MTVHTYLPRDHKTRHDCHLSCYMITVLNAKNTCTGKKKKDLEVRSKIHVIS